MLYNPVFYTFITAHPKCIKIWDATTGALQSVFRDLSQKEITSICLDERKRKLFVGDSRGRMFSINIKNGAKMKKFKKGEKSKSKNKQDISSMYYWGEECMLLSASWDGNVRLFDDSDATEEGIKKYTMDKHKDSVNCLEFKQRDSLCASCGDDGLIFIFNFNSYRQEGILKFLNPKFKDPQPAPVKMLKFLEGTDILVSADLDGFLNFWCVTSRIHPRKNQLLCQVQDHSIADIGDQERPPHFPIRAMDYDPKEQMLYTGDEQGFMIKWDVSSLLAKMQDIQDIIQKQAAEKNKQSSRKATFLTATADTGVNFDEDDVSMVHRWKAHKDLINFVSFVTELQLVASCSFDCNVYMWNKDTFKQIGSLVLGTGLSQND